MAGAAFVLLTAAFATRAPLLAGATRASRLRGAAAAPPPNLGITPCQALPCPCLTTPLPLVGQAEAEHTRVRDAVLEAARQASGEIQAAAVEAAKPWHEKIRGSVVERDVAAQITPVLHHLMQEQVSATKRELKSKEGQQQTMYGAVKANSAEPDQVNTAKVIVAAKQFGTSKVQNLVANATVFGLGEIDSEENEVEELRHRASQLSQAAVIAANMSLSLAVESQALAERLPKEKVQQAEAFARSMNAQAQTLQDQVARSAILSELARKVSGESDSIANNALSRSRVAESKAESALEQAKANAELLSKLHHEAQQVEMKTTATDYAAGK